MIIGRSSRIICQLRFGYDADYSLFWRYVGVWSERKDEYGRRKRFALPIGWLKVYWIHPDTGKIYPWRQRRRILVDLGLQKMMDNRRLQQTP